MTITPPAAATQSVPTPTVTPTEMTKRAAIYLRVSTPRQARKNNEAEGYSIPQQREYCQRRARELGAEVVQEYIDAGESARGSDREGLQAMLADMQSATPTAASITSSFTSWTGSSETVQTTWRC